MEKEVSTVKILDENIINRIIILRDQKVMSAAAEIKIWRSYMALQLSA
jgi:hypothetical protein